LLLVNREELNILITERWKELAATTKSNQESNAIITKKTTNSIYAVVSTISSINNTVTSHQL